MLRRLQAQHIHAIKKVNFDRFYEEQYTVRRDFDKIFENPNASNEEVDAMLEKYELHIESLFEPYAAMHESRPHSNLWGKMVLWGDEALMTDHIGYYSKNVLVHSEPTAGHYHEDYPHHTQAWMYDHKFLNEDFNYEDVERKYTEAQNASGSDPSSLKRELDDSHKH